jgi:hypothetical protein
MLKFTMESPYRDCRHLVYTCPTDDDEMWDLVEAISLLTSDNEQ